MRLIINADDLGAHEAVNEAVFDLLSQRLVTSATILANGPAVEAALKSAPRFPRCSFGVHLNLTEFRPLSSDRRLAPLLDERGAFNAMLNTSPAGVKLDWSLLKAIKNELSSQVEQVLAAGIGVSHLDSHHHIHTLPGLFPVIKYLQQKHSIRKVRIAKNMYAAADCVSKGRFTAKAAFNFGLRHFYCTKTTKGFTNLLTFCELATRGMIRHESVEIMVHPGQVIDAGEEVLLASPWRESLSFETKLISYNDL